MDGKGEPSLSKGCMQRSETTGRGWGEDCSHLFFDYTQTIWAHQKIPRQEVASDEIFWTSLRHEGDGARKNLGSGLGRLAAS